MQNAKLRKVPCLLFCILHSSFCILLLGCSHHSPSQVTFTREPTAGRASKTPSLYQRFPGAYITSNRDGEYDVVLVNDTLRAAVTPAPSSNKHWYAPATWFAPDGKSPLRPVTEPPLQQALHIHVFWRPVSGAMVRESSITNAIVHWYVFSTDASGHDDMLHYQGAAFVKLKPDGDTADITIGDGQISPHQIRGSLKDPIGPSRITGSVTAVRNDARVKDLLARLQEKVAGQDHTWTEAELDTNSALGR
jgi:hypothetical protein